LRKKNGEQATLLEAAIDRKVDIDLLPRSGVSKDAKLARAKPAAKPLAADRSGMPFLISGSADLHGST